MTAPRARGDLANACSCGLSGWVVFAHTIQIPFTPTTTGIKWPTFDSSATVADVKAKFAEFKKQAETLSAQAEKAVAEIEKEVAKTERIKEKVSSMTIDEYLEEFPEETKVIDEQSLKDSMMP